MSIVGNSGTAAHFREWPTEGIQSLALRFEPEDSLCGIYVLTFKDGMRYVGQSRNVVTRFASHRRRWPDITAIAFKAFPCEELDQHERAVLSEIESQGHRVRNLDLAGKPGGDSLLDLIIEKEDQAEWLGSDLEEPTDSPRYLQAVRRRDARRRFDELMSRPDAGPVVAAAASYVEAALPWPSQTEGRFWTISALPSTGRRKDWRRLVCVNAQNAEVLVIGESLTASGLSITGFVNVGTDAWSARRWLRKNGLDSAMRTRSYGTVGNVVQIDFTGIEALEQMLRNGSPLVQPSRQLALSLMRKGPSMYSASHNYHLADEVFARLAAKAAT